MNAPAIPTLIRFGLFELDLARETLRGRGGRQVHLPPQPFKALRLLVERDGALVTRDELREALWGSDTHVDFEHGLNTCVRQVREALGDDAEAPRFVGTVPRRGYRFLAPIERVGWPPPPAGEASAGAGELAAELPGAGVAEAAAVEVPTFRPASSQSASGAVAGADLAAALAFAGAIVVGIAGLGFAPRGGAALIEPWQGAATLLPAALGGDERGGFGRAGERPVALDPDGRIRIAVLPFASGSAGPAERAVAEGFTDEVVARLVTLDPDRFAVVSRYSVAVLAARGLAAAEIGRELRATLLLEGSLQRERGRLRVRVRLIDAADETARWSTVFERAEGDLLATQDEVAARIASSLALGTAVLHEPAEIPPAEAQAAYLRARALLAMNLGTESPRDRLDLAATELDHALALAPRYAAAWGARAELLAMRPLLVGPLAPDLDAARVEVAADRALVIDGGVASAHFARAVSALYFRWDLPAAAVSFERALALAPGSSRTRHWYAGWFAASGRHQEALEMISDAVALDPFAVSVMLDTGWFSFFGGDLDAAAGACARAVGLAPAMVGGWDCLAAVAAARGDLTAAVSARRTGLQRLGVAADQLATLDGLAPAAALDRAAALAVDQVLASGGSATGLAADLLQLGRREQALTVLAQARAVRDPWALFLAVDPRYAPLREEPVFQVLLVPGMPGANPP